MQEIAITKPYRHLRWDISESVTKTVKPNPKRYSVHAALSLKGTGLKKPDLPQLR
jgi:hypothetical protein